MGQSRIEERLEKLEIQTAVTNSELGIIKGIVEEVKVALTNHLMHFSGPQWVMFGAQLLTILGVVIGLVEVVIRR